MKLARTTCLIATLLLMAGSPVLAGPEGQRTKPPVDREFRHIPFDNHQAAERFFDALNVVLESRGRRPMIDLALHGDTVEVSGPPEVVRHVTALMGLHDEPHGKQPPHHAQDHDEVREGRAEAKGPAARERGQRAEGKREKRKKGAKARRAERQANREVRIFELVHAQGHRMADLVDMLGVGSPAPWAVALDERTNSIVVKGPPALVAEAEELVRQLDKPARDDLGEPIMKLMPLTHADARSLAEVVSRVGRRTLHDTTVVADARTNTLVLAGPRDQVLRASTLIERLDIKAKAKLAPKKGKTPGKKAQEKKKAKPDKPTEKVNPANKPTPEPAPTDV